MEAAHATAFDASTLRGNDEKKHDRVGPENYRPALAGSHQVRFRHLVGLKRDSTSYALDPIKLNADRTGVVGGNDGPGGGNSGPNRRFCGPGTPGVRGVSRSGAIAGGRAGLLCALCERWTGCIRGLAGRFSRSPGRLRAGDAPANRFWAPVAERREGRTATQVLANTGMAAACALCYSAVDEPLI